mmetsp:Transcript_65455/g.206802  ORF Transcript_65455/g.206802 Transcript_65455/m.206802 type:complete len:404 (+) Transcript_65455:65-1276(+)
MEVALLKAKLADARTEIRGKDQELAVMHAELQSKIRSMETVPEDTPVRPLPVPAPLHPANADGELWSLASVASLRSQMTALRTEVQQHEARLASQLAGLSAGARALASQLAHEREERATAIAHLRRDLEEQVAAVCSEDRRGVIGGSQKTCLQASHCPDQALGEYPGWGGLEAQCKQQQMHVGALEAVLEAIRTDMAVRSQEQEALADSVVCRNDPQWLQASETMVRLSETCGQLCAEVALLTARLDALGPSQRQEAPEPAARAEAAVDNAARCRHAEAPEVPGTAPPTEGPEPASAEALAKSLAQLEREVAVLAKAIISGSQELNARLAEERSVRRAAEAVLDARIRSVEHEVRRHGSKASPTAGSSPAPTPALTPASSASCLPPFAGRPASLPGAAPAPSA